MKEQPKGVTSNNEIHVMDEEWLYLILEAKQMGLTIHEIRDFFQQAEKE